MIILLVFVLAGAVNARVLSRYCQHLIAAAEHLGLEGRPLAWLVAEHDRLSIRQEWGRATPRQQHQLLLIEDEIRFRRTGRRRGHTRKKTG